MAMPDALFIAIVFVIVVAVVAFVAISLLRWYFNISFIAFFIYYT